jgi:hypothetical protein
MMAKPVAKGQRRAFCRPPLTVCRPEIVAFVHYQSDQHGSMMVNVTILGRTGGSVRANRSLAAMSAVISIAAVALTTVPSVADPAGAPPPARKHPPTRITIYKHPNLVPDPEVRRRQEYYHLFPLEYGMDPMRNSTLFTGGAGLPFWHDRMPFPTCLDLPGFCREP